MWRLQESSPRADSDSAAFGATLAEQLRKADIALMAAKQDGRNRCYVAKPGQGLVMEFAD
jgi:GGDEF domain-containing protein